MERYVCIHGHFYQPPRENPWLEALELQDSAYPYQDWNGRITAECHLPNATSRILNGEGRIARAQNNYSRISFNFGPTLLAWMEEKAPEVYQEILAADRESREQFSGPGSARVLPFSVDFWSAQNIFFEMMQTVFPEKRLRADQGEETARAWLACFASLGEKLHFRVE